MATPKKTAPQKPDGFEYKKPNMTYKEEFCDAWLKGRSEGKSVCEICAELHITRQKAYEWRDKHEEFGYSWSLGNDMYQGWWERVNRLGFNDRDINGTVLNNNMRARFKEWADSKKLEVQGEIKHSVWLDALEDIEDDA